jgi:YidC/Oxa1 family membrane protein insertase
MIYLYDHIIYYPILNALVFLYNTVAFHDLGIAIIFLTILVRIILYPLFHKSARHQAISQRIQPEVKKLQELHKNDRQKQTAAIMALHKEHGINPFSGFLLLIVQLPVLIGLYRILAKVLKPGLLVGLYSFIEVPQTINPIFLGLINLSKGSIFIVGFAAIAQYFQGKLAIPKSPPGHVPSQAEKVSRQMVFIGPGITFMIFYNLPAAVSLYWLVSSLFSILQQTRVNKQLNHGITRTNNKKNS